MFDWLQSLRDHSQLKKIQRQFLEMLADGRHIFDASSNALIGGTDPEVIREDLYTTDQRINRTDASSSSTVPFTVAHTFRPCSS